MAANATKLFINRRLWLAAGVFVLAFAIRVSRPALIAPYDDAYHWKRIAYAADARNPVAHGMTALDFDRDRGTAGAFCPWPPLYDLAMGGIARFAGMEAVLWVPPLLFSLFAALLVFCCGEAGGIVAGVTVALAPYLIGISGVTAIDHHWAEPLLVVAIVAAVVMDGPLAIALAAAMIAALFVQTALIVACGIAMLAIVLFRRDRVASGAIAFTIAAAVVALYRLTRSPAYPSNPWFLGWTHVALLGAAAVACAVATRWSRPIALASGVAVIAPFAGSLLSGARFFAGDPWLQSILEFQPMFREPARIGTDLANIGGGLFALLLVLILQSRRGQRAADGISIATPNGNPPIAAATLVVALFAGIYFLLAVSSRRFLVPAIVLFALSGAIAASSKKRWVAAFAIAATLLPPLSYDAWALVHPERKNLDPVITMAAEVVTLPRGRVLAPWHAGHAIDVLGGHAVVIDNFGSMPDAALFAAANRALLETDAARLIAWCRAHDVLYLALADPALHIPAAAVCSDFDRRLYAGTPLGARTIWSRLWRGEPIAGFTRVRRHVWRIDGPEP